MNNAMLMSTLSTSLSGVAFLQSLRTYQFNRAQCLYDLEMLYARPIFETFLRNELPRIFNDWRETDVNSVQGEQARMAFWELIHVFNRECGYFDLRYPAFYTELKLTLTRLEDAIARSAQDEQGPGARENDEKITKYIQRLYQHFFEELPKLFFHPWWKL